MATIQNQTDPAELANITPNTVGTGIFAIPDPANEQLGAVKKVIVPQITYDICIQRGVFCIAFKWVARVLSATQTDCPTPNALCAHGRCAHDLCHCIDGKCL